MKHNISTLDYFIKYEGFIIPLCQCSAARKLISGLSFGETCGKKQCKTLLYSRVQKEIKNRPEVKARSREARLNFIKSNPEQTAWRLNHKNQSWPEKFFEAACVRNGLDKQFEIVKELSIFPFYVDFAFIDVKVAVEIDGAQHEREEYILSDKRKDEVLNKNGWRVFRVPAKFLFSIETADEVILKLISFIGDNYQKSVCSGIITAKDKKVRVSEEKEKSKQQTKLDIIKRIESSKIDFSKFGWVNKVALILNFEPQSVNRWMKRNMLDFYEEKCFKRK
jgi:very-short-patch-repair endonuclease